VDHTEGVRSQCLQQGRCQRQRLHVLLHLVVVARAAIARLPVGQVALIAFDTAHESRNGLLAGHACEERIAGCCPGPRAWRGWPHRPGGRDSAHAYIWGASSLGMLFAKPSQTATGKGLRDSV
jgi:hypothetical protein